MASASEPPTFVTTPSLAGAGLQTYGQANVKYDWWAGNARFVNLSGLFIAAHVAQAALTVFWAGAFTLYEISQYKPELPMGGTGFDFYCPHLATLGFGIGEGGKVVDLYPYFVIGAVHLISSAVARCRCSLSYLSCSSGSQYRYRAGAAFNFRWDDPKQLGIILGHHYSFWGLVPCYSPEGHALGGDSMTPICKPYALLLNPRWIPLLFTVIKPTLPALTIWKTWWAAISTSLSCSLQVAFGISLYHR